MMQAIKDTAQCSRCGCIALPDATKCPKCGTAYNGNGAKAMFDTVSYFSSPRVVEEEEDHVQVIRAYYQLTCPRHGKIHVRATIVGSPIKCPFKEGSFREKRGKRPINEGKILCKSSPKKVP